jgi:hypothetical protein
MGGGCGARGAANYGDAGAAGRILGLANVKEASLFPRDRKRVSP